MEHALSQASSSGQAPSINVEAVYALLQSVASSVAEALMNPDKAGEAAAKVVALAQLLEAAVKLGLPVDSLKTDGVFVGDSLLYVHTFVDRSGEPYLLFEVYCDADVPTLYRLADSETLKPEDLEGYAEYLKEVAEFMREAARLLREIPGVEATTEVHRRMECDREGHSVEFEYWFEVRASPPPSVDEVRRVLEKASEDIDRIHEVCGMAP